MRYAARELRELLELRLEPVETEVHRVLLARLAAGARRAASGRCGPGRRGGRLGAASARARSSPRSRTSLSLSPSDRPSASVSFSSTFSKYGRVAERASGTARRARCRGSCPRSARAGALGLELASSHRRSGVCVRELVEHVHRARARAVEARRSRRASVSMLGLRGAERLDLLELRLELRRSRSAAARRGSRRRRDVVRTSFDVQRRRRAATRPDQRAAEHRARTAGRPPCARSSRTGSRLIWIIGRPSSAARARPPTPSDGPELLEESASKRFDRHHPRERVQRATTGRFVLPWNAVVEARTPRRRRRDSTPCSMRLSAPSPRRSRASG